MFAVFHGTASSYQIYLNSFARYHETTNKLAAHTVLLLLRKCLFHVKLFFIDFSHECAFGEWLHGSIVLWCVNQGKISSIKSSSSMWNKKLNESKNVISILLCTFNNLLPASVRACYEFYVGGKFTWNWNFFHSLIR